MRTLYINITNYFKDTDNFFVQTRKESAVTERAVDDYAVLNINQALENLAEYRTSHGYGWDDPDHIALFTRYSAFWQIGDVEMTLTWVIIMFTVLISHEPVSYVINALVVNVK